MSYQSIVCRHHLVGDKPCNRIFPPGPPVHDEQVLAVLCVTKHRSLYSLQKVVASSLLIIPLLQELKTVLWGFLKRIDSGRSQEGGVCRTISRVVCKTLLHPQYCSSNTRAFSKRSPTMAFALQRGAASQEESKAFQFGSSLITLRDISRADSSACMWRRLSTFMSENLLNISVSGRDAINTARPP